GMAHQRRRQDPHGVRASLSDRERVEGGVARSSSHAREAGREVLGGRANAPPLSGVRGGVALRRGEPEALNERSRKARGLAASARHAQVRFRPAGPSLVPNRSRQSRFRFSPPPSYATAATMGASAPLTRRQSRSRPQPVALPLHPA